MALSRFRLGVGLVCVLGFGGVAASLLAQYVWGMNPCVMCIEQRMALLGIALAALLCFWLPENQVMRTLSAWLISVPAAFGLSIAGKQIYVQSLPLMAQPSCGAPWTFRWRNAPLFDFYEWFIRGTGACGEVYHVLGVALPVWSALFFAGVLVAIWAFWLAARRAIAW